MKKFVKILSLAALSLLLICVCVPTALYVALSLPWVQNELRITAENELSSLLDTEVSVQSLHIDPFNRITMSGVAVRDDLGKQALSAKKISGRFELLHFLRTRRIVVDYAIVDSLDVVLYRRTPQSDINIQHIISKLSKKAPHKKPSEFDLAISTVEISNSSVRYDILSEPRLTNTSLFDRNHIRITDLNITTYLPKLKNDIISVQLAKFSATERSGISISDLTADISYSPTRIDISNLSVILENSRLAFAPVSICPDSPSDFVNALKNKPITIKTDDNSFVTPSDLKAFLPVLSGLDNALFLSLDVYGSLRELSVNNIQIFSPLDGLNLSASGHLSNLNHRDSLSFSDLNTHVKASRQAISKLLGLDDDHISPSVRSFALKPHMVEINLSASGNIQSFDTEADLITDAGSLRAVASVQRIGKSISIDGSASTTALDIMRFAPKVNVSSITGDFDFDITAGPGFSPNGSLDADIRQLVYNDYLITGISLSAYASRNIIDATLTLNDDSAGKIDLALSTNLDKNCPGIRLLGSLRNLNTDILGLLNKYPAYRLSADIDADISGIRDEFINGHIRISDFSFADNADGDDLKFKLLSIEADNAHSPNTLSVTSDFLNGKAEGHIFLNTLPTQFTDIVSTVLPDFIPAPESSSYGDRLNNFNYEFRLSDAESLSQFFHLPVDIIYPVTLEGVFDFSTRSSVTTIDAPYLLNGKNIIENSVLQLILNGNTGHAESYITSSIPTQKGQLTLVTGMTAAKNRVDTKIDWRIDRDKPITGDISLSTLLGRDDKNHFTAEIAFNPGDITFGDDIWHISRSKISYADKNVIFDNFILTSADQSIAINGVANTDPYSALSIDIKNLHLISIFETLDINKALIGGTATGTFQGAALFSKSPSLFCRNLFVKDISYNYCVIGDADLRAWWDNDKQAFSLSADVLEPGGHHSSINGDIFPAREALDISFNANHVKVGFLKPFMSAFADDITGFASGHARLFGTFKLIDLEGKLFADSLGLKIGFTNTWYYATDSVTITPGRIDIDNITLHDAFGNPARLSGFVSHNFFHDPVFDFRISDAQNLLCYDVTPKISPDWYGRIFGNGGANINGRPGVVNINVNMTTAPKSTFTFVLSDAEEADEYTFITFRDRNAGIITDSILEVSSLPQAVIDYRRRQIEKQNKADAPSEYNMDIQVGITPAARVNLVMDPIGGDEIKSNGVGNLRMTYNSTGNELHLYGNYTIEHGSYNFTLQDIIVKDFTIDEASTISFTGDPYAAELDIRAKYPVNANLSDLDESFLQDKDLNRTNVPVNAVLMAKGDMRQPEISFDLEFPTLNSDVYRKVRSIVSTDEMMNRQIIYLLALNRFYTPEYMSTTKGNELFSVASSTISSQLSSMLGKLSENWSIAPNLRSDRGDFSDIEVDVALSSSLLNNRLRLNGNFGYRDKSLNTNQFIGDFDIEYLLNRRGTWRLKAYNRYNDQNYYLRTAQTTQGVGIMFRRDFDNMFNFLKPKKKTKPTPTQP